MLDENKFQEYMTFLAEMYEKSPSNILFDMYYKLLSKYSNTQFIKAIEELVTTRKYNSFPKPAEIIELIEGAPDDNATIAWSCVYETIEKHGAYRTIDFEDKTIHMAIESLGGWQKLASSSYDDLKFIAKEFQKSYVILKKEPRQLQTPLLLGIDDINNKKGGYQLSKPVLIHDYKKTRKALTNE